MNNSYLLSLASRLISVRSSCSRRRSRGGRSREASVLRDSVFLLRNLLSGTGGTSSALIVQNASSSSPSSNSPLWFISFSDADFLCAPRSWFELSTFSLLSLEVILRFSSFVHSVSFSSISSYFFPFVGLFLRFFLVPFSDSEPEPSDDDDDDDELDDTDAFRFFSKMP